MDDRTLAIVRGAGDLATGTIVKLVKSGYAVIALETEAPAAIRRTVAFSEAVYTGKQQVEDVLGVRARTPQEAYALAMEGMPALLVDPQGESIRQRLLMRFSPSEILEQTGQWHPLRSLSVPDLQRGRM